MGFFPPLRVKESFNIHYGIFHHAIYRTPIKTYKKLSNLDFYWCPMYRTTRHNKLIDEVQKELLLE